MNGGIRKKKGGRILGKFGVSGGCGVMCGMWIWWMCGMRGGEYLGMRFIGIKNGGRKEKNR